MQLLSLSTFHNVVTLPKEPRQVDLLSLSPVINIAKCTSSKYCLTAQGAKVSAATVTVTSYNCCQVLKEPR
jgi:hypothetical protein